VAVASFALVPPLREGYGCDRPPKLGLSAPLADPGRDATATQVSRKSRQHHSGVTGVSPRLCLSETRTGPSEHRRNPKQTSLRIALSEHPSLLYKPAMDAILSEAGRSEKATFSTAY